MMSLGSIVSLFLYESRSRISFLKSFTFKVQNLSTHTQKRQLVLVSPPSLTSWHSEEEKIMSLGQDTNITK